MGEAATSEVTYPSPGNRRLGRRSGNYQQELSLPSFMSLRWIGLAAELATLATVELVWNAGLPLTPLLLLVLLGALSNLALLLLGRRTANSGRTPRVGTRAIGLTLLFDVLRLTAVLGLTGGPANPFSVIYLVHVMLAAIATHRVWAWLVMALSSAGFGLLFFVSIPLPETLGGGAHHMHGTHGTMSAQPYSAHLQGMWLAYSLAAAVIAGLVSHVSASLRHERERRARSERLLGLATLAAGAAHEIGNPLGTIRVAASELARDLKAEGASEERLDDLRLIGEEVNRARDVLVRMSVGAGELIGECPVSTKLSDIMNRAAKQLGEGKERIDVIPPAADDQVQWPVEATSQAISQLLRNALEASPGHESVRFEAHLEADGVALAVSDKGEGMSTEAIERAGEPFFTTKPSGGTGLGLFVARSLIEHMGGRIHWDSATGQGTSVKVWLPLGVQP